MKTFFKLPILLLALCCMFTACGGDDSVSSNQIPIAEDFNIEGLTQTYDGDPKPVTITPKEGKSTGIITVYYEGTGTTSYTKSTDAPTEVGTYSVTFDITAGQGFYEETGLLAGTLNINAFNQDPVAGDFDITGLSQTFDGQPKSVSITPQLGKSTGTLTIYYEGTGTTSYTKSTDAPTAVGSYTVTFDVAASTVFNAATNLSAGMLIIEAATPTVDDFDIGNLTQLSNNITAVTITAKEGKSTGAITIYYDGSTTLPTSVGDYAVTFDVAASTGWNAVQGLSAGTLIINLFHQDPVAGDFDITGLSQTFDGQPKSVSITPQLGKSTGALTIYYEGTGGTNYTKSTDAPSSVGTYTVTFDVAASTGFYAATGLMAGTLVINLAPITAVAVAVTDPVFNAVPANVGDVNITTVDPNFSVTSITWDPDDNPFHGLTQYTAQITLTANTGYTFDGLTGTTARINGQATTLSNHQTASVSLAYTFAALTPTVITTAAVSVTDPVRGQTSNATATPAGGSNFTAGTVSWTPTPTGNVFQPSTAYTATVTLTAASGFTFTGLTSATISGATATISNNNGTAVTLARTFPQTAAVPSVATPVATPPAGTYNNDQTVTLTTTTVGATIYYTTNGDDPTVFSTVYSDSSDIRITAPRTIKAFAVAQGMTASTVMTAEYKPACEECGNEYDYALGDTGPGGVESSIFQNVLP